MDTSIFVLYCTELHCITDFYCKSPCWPILWGHSGPVCHALSLLLLSLWTSILHCHSPGVATVARRLRYSYSWLWLIVVVVSTVATPGEWQCKIRTGGVRQLAVANGPHFSNASCLMISIVILCVWAWLYRTFGALTISMIVDVAIWRRASGSVVNPRVAKSPRSPPVPRPVHRKRLGPHQLCLRHGGGGSGYDWCGEFRRSYANTSQHCSAQERLITS